MRGLRLGAVGYGLSAPLVVVTVSPVTVSSLAIPGWAVAGTPPNDPVWVKLVPLPPVCPGPSPLPPLPVVTMLLVYSIAGGVLAGSAQLYAPTWK
ncbi:hypothetical protein BN970_01854 [Mycolicibacterium conceptionense]|uniref:Uncharacterized protein n=1 Tax=Mycolicibacterium conceptionense TaxID=451644 RepID=A0A0U1D9N2_9MYCO|nr:hypothetical protein BN970_01854 [Mycolicibacterium conceptionense]